MTHVRCEVIVANDIVTSLHDLNRIDILLFFRQCQIFSPAYARLGRNDRSNKAHLLATEDLFKKKRLRLVKLEDAFGMIPILENLSRCHEMIRVLFKVGFSVQWKGFLCPVLRGTTA